MLMRFEYPGTVNELIDNFLSSDAPRAYADVPAVDIARTENETVINMELPGVKKEDVGISVEDGVLTVKAERKPAELPENARVLLNERGARAFNRSFRLGREVDAEKISAEMNNGVLRIVLPVAESSKARTIGVR